MKRPSPKDRKDREKPVIEAKPDTIMNIKNTKKPKPRVIRPL